MTVAKQYYEQTSSAYIDFLNTRPLAETHDVADASLFVMMALEDTSWSQIRAPSLRSLRVCMVGQILFCLPRVAMRCCWLGSCGAAMRITMWCVLTVCADRVS